MSKDTTYRIKNMGAILSHFPGLHRFVHDTEDDADILRQARIRSGDYLMTLATELEQLAENLSSSKAPEAPALERIVAELIYVERNYKVVPRD